MPKILKINMLRNISTNQQYLRNAVRRSSTTSLREARQIMTEQNRVTPQSIGNATRRFSMSDQAQKTPQDRFLDFYI